MDKEAFKKAYRSEDLEALKGLGVYDELRVHTWEAGIERANREKDPASKYEQLSKVWGEVTQTTAYFLGKNEMEDALKDKGLDKEASLNTYFAIGSSLVKKLLDE